MQNQHNQVLPREGKVHVVLCFLQYQVFIDSKMLSASNHILWSIKVNSGVLTLYTISVSSGDSIRSMKKYINQFCVN